MRRFLWMVAFVFASGAWQSSAAAVAFACEVAGRAIGVVADNEYRAMCAAVQSCDMGLRAYADGNRCLARDGRQVFDYVCKRKDVRWEDVNDAHYLPPTAQQDLPQSARLIVGPQFGDVTNDCMSTERFRSLRKSLAMTAMTQSANDAAVAPVQGQAPAAATPSAQRATTQRSPWLDAIRNNSGASGPCGEANRACEAACGTGRPGSSEAALKLAACKQACGQQRTQCALGAAKPLEGGQ